MYQTTTLTNVSTEQSQISNENQITNRAYLQKGGM